MKEIPAREDTAKYIGDLLYRQYLLQPEKAAVIFEGQQYSYEELYFISRSISQEISNRYGNLGAIGIMLPRSLHYLLAYFSTAFLGAIIVPIDAEHTFDEVKRTIDYCQVELLILKEDHHLNLKLQENNVAVFHLKNAADYKFERNYSLYKEPIKVEIDTDNTALLLHTSGSIDLPKRVMLSHHNVIENAKSHVIHMGLNSDDTVLITLPMHFGYCNTAQIISHLLIGGTLVILDGIFSPHRLFQYVEKYKITVFTAVPAILFQMLNFKHSSRYDISSLRQVTYGGAPFPIEKMRLLEEKYPTVQFCQTYGLTEAGPRLTGVAPERQKLTYSAGTPLPNVELKIVDKNGLEVSANQVGEIIAKSPGIMKGYFNRPEETAKVLKNGWLYTGDLGYMAENGELYVVGRIKNIIIRGGVNIYPEEIETYLLVHPKVKEVLVYGVPHDGLGETPHALVVLNDEADVNQLVVFCEQGLSKYKIPSIQFVESLPRTYNNKIKRGVNKDSGNKVM